MLEDLLAEISERGWWLYSLSQNQHEWTCHLRSSPIGTAQSLAYGCGQTPVEAIDFAMNQPEYQKVEAIAATVEERKSLADLLAKLPTAKVYRRF